MSACRSDNAALFAALREYVDQSWPGHRAVRLRAKLDDGQWVSLPVPRVLIVPAVSSPPARPLGEMQSAILQCLAELPAGEKLVGEKVAERAGYPYHGRFRQTLSDLVTSGRIKNSRPGYSL